MVALDKIRQHFATSIEVRVACVEVLADLIALSTAKLVDCLLQDGKILLCGQGGSAANCLHFSNSMLNRYEVDRPPLPVLALTTDIVLQTAMVNEGVGEQFFARQIQALGTERDCLLALCCSGQSSSIIHAINSAHDKEMDVIVLCGRDGGVLENYLGPEDFLLKVPCDKTGNIREMHLFILHCFSDMIDEALFGEMME